MPGIVVVAAVVCCFRISTKHDSTSCFPSNKLPKSVFLSRPTSRLCRKVKSSVESRTVGGWCLVFGGWKRIFVDLAFPIGSRYGTCTYIWCMFMVNVGKHTSPMDPLGLWICCCWNPFLLVRFLWEVPKTGQSAPNEIGNSPRSATTNNQQQPRHIQQPTTTTTNNQQQMRFPTCLPSSWSLTHHFFAEIFHAQQNRSISRVTKQPKFWQ